MKRAWSWVAAVVVPAAVVVGQYQINPQVNTGIYAGSSASSVAYSARVDGRAYGTGTANGQAMGSGAYGGQGASRQYAATSIQQGSVRYNGYNNAFNETSKSADTRQDYATTGVYAPTAILNGASGAYQSKRAYSPPLQSPQGGSVSYQAPAPQGQGAVNAQINAQVNGAVNAQAW